MAAWHGRAEIECSRPSRPQQRGGWLQRPTRGRDAHGHGSGTRWPVRRCSAWQSSRPPYLQVTRKWAFWRPIDIIYLGTKDPAARAGRTSANQSLEWLHGMAKQSMVIHHGHFACPKRALQYSRRLPTRVHPKLALLHCCIYVPPEQVFCLSPASQSVANFVFHLLLRRSDAYYSLRTASWLERQLRQSAKWHYLRVDRAEHVDLMDSNEFNLVAPDPIRHEPWPTQIRT